MKQDRLKKIEEVMNKILVDLQQTMKQIKQADRTIEKIYDLCQDLQIEIRNPILNKIIELIEDEL